LLLAGNNSTVLTDNIRTGRLAVTVTYLVRDSLCSKN